MEEYNTLEEAKAGIIRLQEQVTELTNERDSLSQDKENLSTELESVRKLNQQYFNKLSQQFLPTESKTNNDEEAPSCEEFAKTLSIF